jgi:hypothetical protein
MTSLTDKDMRIAVRLYSALDKLDQDDHWWRLGVVHVSKKHPHYAAGYSHPLDPTSSFRAQPFDLDGRRGVALVFATAGDPGEYFAGWVPPEREAEAKAWVATLNAEIQQRLAASG